VHRAYPGQGQVSDKLNLEAIERIKQRTYQPTLIDGEAVPVCADVAVEIHLK
jgi:hypothetical protein